MPRVGSWELASDFEVDLQSLGMSYKACAVCTTTYGSVPPTVGFIAHTFQGKDTRSSYPL